jgi:hypothetical protein
VGNWTGRASGLQFSNGETPAAHVHRLLEETLNEYSAAAGIPSGHTPSFPSGILTRMGPFLAEEASY